MRTLLLSSCLFFGSAGAVAQASTPLALTPSAWTDRDLSALDSVLGNASVVGLGESVHATESFSEAKLRLIQYLVTKQGFRALAWETPWREAEAVSRYISTCEGTGRSAIDHLFQVWKSQSVAELLTWLCEFNRTHPQDPVHFYGFDIQNQNDLDLREVFENLGGSLSQTYVTYSQALSACVGWTSAQLGHVDSLRREFYAESIATQSLPAAESRAALQSCLRGIDLTERYFAAHANAFTAHQLRRISLSLAGIRASELSIRLWSAGDRRSSFEGRDVGMAKAFFTIREMTAATAKTIVWAHNAHLAKAYQAVDDPLFGRAHNFGYWLATTLADQYAALALTGYQISIHWPGSEPSTYLQGSPSSVEGHMHLNFGGNRLVDFRESTPGIDYSEARPFGTATLVPQVQFNGMIYMDRVNAMISPGAGALPLR